MFVVNRNIIRTIHPLERAFKGQKAYGKEGDGGDISYIR